MGETLPGAILKECNRVRELVRHYVDLGPVGDFGRAVLEQDIRRAEAALASGDTVEMIRALQALRECE